MEVVVVEVVVVVVVVVVNVRELLVFGPVPARAWHSVTLVDGRQGVPGAWRALQYSGNTQEGTQPLRRSNTRHFKHGATRVTAMFVFYCCR